MARKMRTKRNNRRGGGYGFGGSIMPNVSGSGAGNALWSSTGGECGVARVGNNDLQEGGRRRRRRKLTRSMSKTGGSTDVEVGNANYGGAGATDGGEPAAVQGRGGNERVGGRRRRHSKKHGKKSKRRSTRRRGGGSVLALQQPISGYTFNGNGAAGIADAVPVAPNVTYV